MVLQLQSHLFLSGIYRHQHGPHAETGKAFKITPAACGLLMGSGCKPSSETSKTNLLQPRLSPQQRQVLFCATELL